MRKSVSLFTGLILMLAGWVSAFLLAGNPFAEQSYWLLPAVTLGAGIGLCLRFINGRKAALALVVTSVMSLAVIQLFLPGTNLSFGNLRSLFSATSPYGRQIEVQIDDRFRQIPFDQPLLLRSPAALDLSLFTRLPAGVDDFCFSSDMTLYASLPALGAVYKVRKDALNETAKPELLLHGLDNPSGLNCAKSQLLVAESSRITAYAYSGKAERVLVENLPDDGGHLTHRLLAVPGGLLFSLGSRCDACQEKEPSRGTVQMLSSSGVRKLFARGLRQVGGLVEHAEDGSLWANERSRLFPAPGAGDELNRLQEGADYGWPRCEIQTVAGSENTDCLNIVEAALLLRNRANPAGLMSSYRLKFPQVYRNSLLMVLQGDNDNRIVPAVVRIPLTEGRASEPVAFLDGWDGVQARPSAIHPGPDGAVFIADEVNGAIYRAAWKNTE